MAHANPATRSPRFRRSGRSRRQHRQPHRRSPRPPILPDIYGQDPSQVPHHGPLRRIPHANAPTSQPPENRFPHKPSPVARGFLPWRKSYTCRRLISFTHRDAQLSNPSRRKQTFVRQVLSRFSISEWQFRERAIGNRFWESGTRGRPPTRSAGRLSRVGFPIRKIAIFETAPCPAFHTADDGDRYCGMDAAP